jgi:hypothetical protein
MKTYIIYVQGHDKSERYAEEALSSCEGKNFSAELFVGATKDTVKKWTTKYPYLLVDKPRSRIERFRAESSDVYWTKKACLTNQVRLWNKCLELNEPIVCLEHDARCVREWDSPEFDEFLILNPVSGFNQPCFDHVKKYDFKEGVHSYRSNLTYYFDNDWIGAYIPPGLGSYAITPAGARKLIDAVKQSGCEQGDMTTNSYNVRLQYAAPDYFGMAKNLKMSIGSWEEN